MSQRKRRSNGSTAESNSNRNVKPSPTSLTKRAIESYATRGRGVAQTPAERADVRRVIMFPFIGDTKATAVRPRVTEREVAAARRLTFGDTGGRKRCREIRAVHYGDQVAA